MVIEIVVGGAVLFAGRDPSLPSVVGIERERDEDEDRENEEEFHWPEGSLESPIGDR